MWREEDVEVARQRARPVRGDRALRGGRAALLLLPRGHFGQDGSISPPASRLAMNEWQTTSATASRILAMSSATAPASCRLPRSTRCSPRTSKAWWPRFCELLDRASESGLGGGLEAGANDSTLRGGDAGVGAGQGGPTLEQLDEVLYTSPGHAGDDAAAGTYLPQTSERLRARSPRFTRARRTRSRPGGQTVERVPRSSEDTRRRLRSRPRGRPAELVGAGVAAEAIVSRARRDHLSRFSIRWLRGPGEPDVGPEEAERRRRRGQRQT